MEMLDQELDCIPNAGSSDLIVLFNVQYSLEVTAMKLIQASDGTEPIFTASATDDAHVKLHIVGLLRS